MNGLWPPGGDDASPGNPEHPFATVERARKAVRENNDKRRKQGLASTGTTVWLAGGTYQIDHTFELGKADSGAEGAEVLYRAAGGSTVRLSGGRELADWKPVRNPALLARIDATTRGKVLQTNLKAQGITDFGAVDRSPVEMFFGDQLMSPARWPNEGWAEIGKLPDGKDGLRFQVDSPRLARWAAAEEPWVAGYWFHLWSFEWIPIAKVDAEKGELVLGKKHNYGLKTGRPFRVENLLEELDTPGEWFLERKSGDLFFWPPETSTGVLPVLSVLKTPLVRFRDASHITLRGITFAECRGDAVEIQGGEHCQLVECTVRNTGGRGVVVNGGKHHRVNACEVTGTGAGAISLSGGDRKTLEPSGHEVVSCNLHHYARRKRTYQPAVRLTGVGHRVAHCQIHHAPHVGILFTGNDHLLEFNEVHHVCQETDDAGAFYTGRNWTARGHLIRHNHFHHIGNSMLGVHGAHHVYLDDCASGVTIRGNFFEGGNRTAFIGGGRDNVVENNLFIDCDKAIHVDDRGLNWTDRAADGGTWGIYKRLRSVPFTKPPWSVRYPALATILENNPRAPLGNRIERNVIVGGTPYGFRMKDDSVLRMKDNWTGGDPGFVDPAKRDFRLRPDSPARKTGFKEIPFDKIGPGGAGSESTTP